MVFIDNHYCSVYETLAITLEYQEFDLISSQGSQRRDHGRSQDFFRGGGGTLSKNIKEYSKHFQKIFENF